MVGLVRDVKTIADLFGSVVVILGFLNFGLILISPRLSAHITGWWLRREETVAQIAKREAAMSAGTAGASLATSAPPAAAATPPIREVPPGSAPLPSGPSRLGPPTSPSWAPPAPWQPRRAPDTTLASSPAGPTPPPGQPDATASRLVAIASGWHRRYPVLWRLSLVASLGWLIGLSVFMTGAANVGASTDVTDARGYMFFMVGIALIGWAELLSLVLATSAAVLAIRRQQPSWAWGVVLGTLPSLFILPPLATLIFSLRGPAPDPAIPPVSYPNMAWVLCGVSVVSVTLCGVGSSGTYLTPSCLAYTLGMAAVIWPIVQAWSLKRWWWAGLTAVFSVIFLFAGASSLSGLVFALVGPTTPAQPQPQPMPPLGARAPYGGQLPYGYGPPMREGDRPPSGSY